MRMGFIEVWNGKQTSRDSSRGDYICGIVGSIQMCVASLSLPGSLMPIGGAEQHEAERSHFIPVSSDIQPLPPQWWFSCNGSQGMSMIRLNIYKNRLFVFYCAKENRKNTKRRSNRNHEITTWESRLSSQNMRREMITLFTGNMKPNMCMCIHCHNCVTKDAGFWACLLFWHTVIVTSCLFAHTTLKSLFLFFPHGFLWIFLFCFVADQKQTS